MVRAVTFWYTKELSTFENNEDLPSPKIDVTRYMLIKIVFPLGEFTLL
jgi:hypothetical protein